MNPVNWLHVAAGLAATGFFFLGQQDLFSKAVRGSPILFVLALAPLAVVLFWLVRLRFAEMFGRLTLRVPFAPASVAAAPSAAAGYAAITIRR